ncbi:MAG: diaminopimelate epimerase [Bacteroidetes bacterium]|nr:diaminopimelate epimerase [Bacteroidota bacterium]
MKLPFYKYQGTGNDFVIIDNRSLGLTKEDTALIRRLCDRRFGIGGDGLIYLQNRDGFDFEMVYFNSDGRESTMCGNGGRCIVKFAHDLGLGDKEFSFLAIDGPHRGKILENGIVSIQMQDVTATLHRGDHYTLDTGSPHFVRFVKDIQHYPVVEKGREVRYSDTYKEGGINVNFAEELSRGNIYVRTYERGVEDETFSCGTGVVASAIAYFYDKDPGDTNINIKTLGGQLNVQFDLHDLHFTNIWLTGPAVQVYSGETTI